MWTMGSKCETSSIHLQNFRYSILPRTIQTSASPRIKLVFQNNCPVQKSKHAELAYGTNGCKIFNNSPRCQKSWYESNRKYISHNAKGRTGYLSTNNWQFLWTIWNAGKKYTNVYITKSDWLHYGDTSRKNDNGGEGKRLQNKVLIFFFFLLLFNMVRIWWLASSFQPFSAIMKTPVRWFTK